MFSSSLSVLLCACAQNINWLSLGNERSLASEPIFYSESKDMAVADAQDFPFQSSWEVQPLQGAIRNHRRVKQPRAGLFSMPLISFKYISQSISETLQ